MRRSSFLFPLALSLVATALVVFSPSRVSAIVYGFVDTNNVFRNAGAFIVRSTGDRNIFPICSGTLISSTVFLTASHCTVFFERDLAPARLFGVRQALTTRSRLATSPSGLDDASFP